MLGDTRHRRPGRQGRLGGLAVPAALRLPRLLRGAARRPRARPLAARARAASDRGRPARYVGDSAALETTYTTATGGRARARRDAVGDGRADLVRRVDGVEGTVRIRHEWVVRFGYGKIRPWVRRAGRSHGSRVITAVAGPDRLVLRGPRLPRAVGRPARRRVRGPGGRGADVLHHLGRLAPPAARAARPSTRGSAPPSRSVRALGRPVHATTGPTASAVVRSLLTLRLLTHGGTGGIVAAPDHLAARGLRRRAQLGLPVLLAARRRR